MLYTGHGGTTTYAANPDQYITGITVDVSLTRVSMSEAPPKVANVRAIDWKMNPKMKETP